MGAARITPHPANIAIEGGYLAMDAARITHASAPDTARDAAPISARIGFAAIAIEREIVHVSRSNVAVQSARKRGIGEVLPVKRRGRDALCSEHINRIGVERIEKQPA